MKILLVSLIKDYLRADRPKKPKGTIFLRFPSLALANIAALTPDKYDIQVCDEQIAPIDYDLDVDLVAITVNTSVSQRAYEIADRFREKGTKVVLGGLHPSLMPYESSKHADSIVIGDADGAWRELLVDFENNNLKDKYVSDQTKNLVLPTPRWEIFRGMGYVTTNFIEATRGCSNHCRFCSTSPFYGHKHRTRQIDDIVRDIKSVQSFPRKFIFFVDDNIVCDKEYAKELFKALIPLRIYWISQATVDIGDDEELVKLAARSGCFGLFLGFDSISKANLEDMNKKHNRVENYRKTVDLLHRQGIGVEGGFIFGYDQDTPEVFRDTLNFLVESNMESFLAIYLTPIPGTEMYNDFREQQRLTTDDLAVYDFRHVVVNPKNMTTEQLYDGVSWLSREFNSKRSMKRRIMVKSTDFLKHPSIRRLLGLVGTLAINLAFRSRIKDLSVDGTFPRSFRKI
jgi:radical SAM superfamily enzyme YgiQ (UPF0313 family)